MEDSISLQGIVTLIGFRIDRGRISIWGWNHYLIAAIAFRLR